MLSHTDTPHMNASTRLVYKLKVHLFLYKPCYTSLSALTRRFYITGFSMNTTVLSKTPSLLTSYPHVHRKHNGNGNVSCL